MAQKKQAYVNELAARLIRDIRHGRTTSRLELSRLHKLAPSTMGIHIDRLIASGHLREESSNGAGQRGRPMQRLRLQGGIGLFVGVEFEARQLHAAALDFAGKVVRHEHREIPAGATAAEVLSRLEKAIIAVHDGRPEPLLGIGVGSPGLVEPEAGIARHYRFIEGWNDVPVAARLRQRFGVPVLLENNVRATALGIRLFDQTASFDNFIAVLIRSGVGAGVLRDGALYTGTTHSAGEIGRIPLPGSSFTVEDITSLPAILREAQANLERFPKSVLSGQELTIGTLIDAARRDDPFARECFTRAIRQLGWLCHVLALVEDPPAIVFAGPLAALGDWLRTEIEAAAVACAENARTQLPQILVTTLGESVGALGAASLAIEAWKPAA